MINIEYRSKMSDCNCYGEYDIEGFPMPPFWFCPNPNDNDRITTVYLYSINARDLSALNVIGFRGILNFTHTTTPIISYKSLPLLPRNY